LYRSFFKETFLNTVKLQKLFHFCSASFTMRKIGDSIIWKYLFVIFLNSFKSVKKFLLIIWRSVYRLSLFVTSLSWLFVKGSHRTFDRFFESFFLSSLFRIHDDWSRESLLNGKTQSSWPPCTNKLRGAPFNPLTIYFSFFLQNNLSLWEGHRTEPSPSVSVPWLRE